jgi:MFS family permease
MVAQPLQSDTDLVSQTQKPVVIFEKHLSTDAASSITMICVSTAMFLTAPVVGTVSDKIGRKPFVYISAVIACATLAFMGFCPRNFLIYVINSIIMGVGLGKAS